MKFLQCFAVVYSAPFEYFIFGTIFLASALIALDTYDSLESIRPVLEMIEHGILIIFSLEVVLKLVAESLKPHLYFVGPNWFWNNFDFLIVILSMPFTLGNRVSALRLLRLCRLFKLLRKVPRVHMLVQGLLAGMKQISFVVLLMVLIFYLYGVLGIILFRKNDPWHWLNLDTTLETLVRLATMEDWTDVYYINFYGCDVYSGRLYSANTTLDGRSCRAPGAQPVLSTIYFISFTVISAFVLLSMFVGAITLGMIDCVEEINAEVQYQSKEKHDELERKILKGLSEEREESGLETKTPSVSFINREKKLAAYVRQAFTGTATHLYEAAPYGTAAERAYARLAGVGSAVTRSPAFQWAITGVICVTGFMVGLRASSADMEADEAFHAWYSAWNLFAGAVFSAELVLKLLAEGFTPVRFFVDAHWQINGEVCVCVCVGGEIGRAVCRESVCSLV